MKQTQLLRAESRREQHSVSSSALPHPPQPQLDSRQLQPAQATGSVRRCFGLLALATVVFDIDCGQKLDAVYPSDFPLTDSIRKSVAHLALPHSNRQEEGDTQFTVRFRTNAAFTRFLYGFVLFRQRRDVKRNRGYFQKSLVMLSEKPFVDLYERILRVVGPLFFQVGTPVLQAVYENIAEWPEQALNTPVVLPLAGTFITCIIPSVLDYETYPCDQTTLDAIDNSQEVATKPNDKDDSCDIDDSAPSPQRQRVSTTENDVPSQSNPPPSCEPQDDDQQDSPRQVTIRDGRFVVGQPPCDEPNPCFGDILNSSSATEVTPYENVGLYTSFLGVENCLWTLWQFAITGQSLLILAPHARTCSQATLAFTSLIAPLRFEGDYRPYYTLYEADFDEISRRQVDGVNSPERMAVVGTTNPFFLKSLSRWPNALVFPFLDPSFNKKQERSHTVTSLFLSSNNSEEGDDEEDFSCVSMRIKKATELDSFEDSDRAILLRRSSQLVRTDTTILRQLITPPEVHVTQTANTEEKPYEAINNAILRKHFRRLTKRFLRPFEQYFGMWKPQTSSLSSSAYMSVRDCMKPFDLEEFLSQIDVTKLPPQIRLSKWRELYTAFVKSPHFLPWFRFRRDSCVVHFNETLRTLRREVSSDMIVRSPLGGKLSRRQCIQLRKEIEIVLELEKTKRLGQSETFDSDNNYNNDTDEQGMNEEQIKAIEAHLEAVQKRIKQDAKSSDSVSAEVHP